MDDQLVEFFGKYPKLNEKDKAIEDFSAGSGFDVGYIALCAIAFGNNLTVPPKDKIGDDWRGDDFTRNMSAGEAAEILDKALGNDENPKTRLASKYQTALAVAGAKAGAVLPKKATGPVKKTKAQQQEEERKARETQQQEAVRKAQQQQEEE